MNHGSFWFLFRSFGSRFRCKVGTESEKYDFVILYLHVCLIIISILFLIENSIYFSSTYIHLSVKLLLRLFLDPRIFVEKHLSLQKSDLESLPEKPPPQPPAPKLNIFCTNSHSDSKFIGTPMNSSTTSDQLLICIT